MDRFSQTRLWSGIGATIKGVICLMCCFGQMTEAKESTLKFEKMDPFLVVTIPKSGTHLLGKCMRMISGLKANCQLADKTDHTLWVERLVSMWDERCYFNGHHPPSDELIALLTSHQFKVVFLIRDPRDLAISTLNWYLEGNWPNFGQPFVNAELSYEQKLHLIITGEQFGVSSFERYVRPNLPWLDYPKDFVHVVRFEDLVGKAGGGSKNAQEKAILEAAKHIGLDLSKKQIKEVAKNLFADTNTFRKGQIGQWKEIYTQEHKNTFKQLYGEELIELGYEKDLNW